MKVLKSLVIILLCSSVLFAQSGVVQQSTAKTIMLGPFTLDGITPLTGYGPVAAANILVSKNGAAFGAKNDTSTCVADATKTNYCATTLSTTDTNTVGMLTVTMVTTSGTTVMIEKNLMVAAAASYAANFSGSVALATDIVSAGAITTLAGAVVNVDLTDTVTTYTGNTLQTGDSFAKVALMDTIPRGVALSNFAITFFNSSGVRVTGLTTAQISCNVFLDGAAANVVDDTTETELNATTAPGVYLVDLTGAETTGDSGVLVCLTTGGLVSQSNFQTQH